MCFFDGILRIFFYDVVTGFIVLVDKGNGVLVDTSLALDGQSRSWATEKLSVIMVIGHLECSSASVGPLLLSHVYFVIIIDAGYLLSDNSSYPPHAKCAIVPVKHPRYSPSYLGYSCCWVGS